MVALRTLRINITYSMYMYVRTYVSVMLHICIGPLSPISLCTGMYVLVLLWLIGYVCISIIVANTITRTNAMM